MPAGCSNVVDLGRFEHLRRTSGPGGNRVLDDCGEMAASRLAVAVAQALELADKDLTAQAAATTTAAKGQLYIEAMVLARDGVATLPTVFKQEFFQAFKAASRKGMLFQRGPEPDVSGLSLVDPDDLEESLAASNLANAIHNASGEEMFGLNHRIGVLLNQAELSAEDNPLGPDVIGTAIVNALRTSDCGLKVKLLLVPVLNKHLPERVKGVYQELNRFLIDKGVLPAIRVGIKRTASPTDTPVGGQYAASEAQPPGQDLFAALRELLGGAGSGSIPPPGGMPGVLAASPQLAPSLANWVSGGGMTPVFMQTLTRLQHGQVDGSLAQGLDTTSLANGQINVLRQIRNNGMAANMGQVDAMTLDIVAMLFDFVLDDSRVPDAMKALIGRLQIPVLKVAMLDKNFFSQKVHPARKLLDILAESSMGWDPEEGHESGLYLKVGEVVQRILNEFDAEVDIFSAVLADFEHYLGEEKHRIDEATSRSAQVIYTREQRELAGIVAQDAIHSQLFDKNVPVLIQDFLHSHWQRLLTKVYSESGEGGEAWKGAVEGMSELVWSIAPKTNSEERKQLVQCLPGLLRRLSDGLKAIEAPGEVQDKFFAGLVRCHADAVKTGLKGSPAGPDGRETASDSPAWQPVPQPSFEGPHDFEDIPVLTEVVEVDRAVLHDISVVPITSQHGELDEITIGDVGWLAGAAREGDQYDILVRQLKRGTWIELRQEDGSTARAKLAWISPMRGLYLFTNRLGQRAMSINAAGLAAKLREGRVQIIDNAPLVDRAVNGLLAKLKKTA